MSDMDITVGISTQTARLSSYPPYSEFKSHFEILTVDSCPKRQFFQFAIFCARCCGRRNCSSMPKAVFGSRICHQMGVLHLDVKAKTKTFFFFFFFFLSVF